MALPDDPLKWAVQAFHDRRQWDYRKYSDYLDGNQPLVFATTRFTNVFGRIFESFSYNRAPVVVDAHADRLQVTGFGANRPEIAQAAQDLWDLNQMDIRAGHLEFDAFAFGDSYIVAELHPVRGQVVLWTNGPENVRVRYSDEWPGEIDLAAKAWTTADSYTRLNLYFRDRIEKYISRNRTPSGIPLSPNVFDRYETDDEPWPVPLPITDTVPVFHIANNGRTNSYGVSELKPVLPLQDALNKSLMDKMVAMEFAAFPQRVIMGLDDDPDNADLIRRFQAGVDRIMTLSDPSSRIAEFSPANISQYIAVAEFWDTAISRTTKVPVHYLRMQGDFPSGRAMRIAEAPFTAKLVDRARAFGAVLAEAVRYGLRLEGIPVDPGELRVNWASVAPMSIEDELELAMMRKTLGFPLESNLREMGYEPDQIDDILEAVARDTAAATRAFDAGFLPPPLSED